MKDNYDLSLYTYLKSKVDIIRLTGAKDETMIRCPFCMDSKKSKFDTHMYIHNEAPFMYYCQLCENSGYGKDLLNKLNLYDNEITQHMNKAYNDYLEESNIKYGFNIKDLSSKETIILPNQYTPLEDSKIQYLNNRLNINIDEEDVNNFRYILNLYDYLNNNDIVPDNFTKGQLKMIDIMNQECSMFLLNDKSTIIGRYMNAEKGQQRYYKLKLFNRVDRSRSFYTIKNNIDLSLPVHNLYITEGIYDILGIYYYNDKKLSNNDLYIANNGKGYLSTLNYMTKIGITNCNINIYSDNDVNIDFYKYRLKNSILTKYNSANLYYNTFPNEKDFGIPKDNIKLSVKQIITV